MAGIAERVVPVLGADGSEAAAVGVVTAEGLGGLFAGGIGIVAAEDAGCAEGLQPAGQSGSDAGGGGDLFDCALLIEESFAQAHRQFIDVPKRKDMRRVGIG